MKQILNDLQERYQQAKDANLAETKTKLMAELKGPDYQEDLEDFIQFIIFDLNKYDRATLMTRYRQHKNRQAMREQR